MLPYYKIKYVKAAPERIQFGRDYKIKTGSIYKIKLKYICFEVAKFQLIKSRGTLV
jgi:hypothetical protein